MPGSCGMSNWTKRGNAEGALWDDLNGPINRQCLCEWVRGTS